MPHASPPRLSPLGPFPSSAEFWAYVDRLQIAVVETSSGDMIDLEVLANFLKLHPTSQQRLYLQDFLDAPHLTPQHKLAIGQLRFLVPSAFPPQATKEVRLGTTNFSSRDFTAAAKVCEGAKTHRHCCNPMNILVRVICNASVNVVGLKASTKDLIVEIGNGSFAALQLSPGIRSLKEEEFIRKCQTGAVVILSNVISYSPSIDSFWRSGSAWISYGADSNIIAFDESKAPSAKQVEEFWDYLDREARRASAP